MVSTDGEFILATANQYFEEGKWKQAISLYERTVPYYAGKEEAVDIAHNSATANFNDENFRLAGFQFKNFHEAYKATDPRAEEALFQSAFCYYKGSPEYNLDQTNTFSALKELQFFIDSYPESDKIPQINDYIDELQAKLEKKAFEIAKTYYKTVEYRAASVALDNMLEEFPDTEYREEAMFLSLKAKHDWAVNSRIDRRKGYIRNAHTQYRLFAKAFPNSKFMNEAQKLDKNLDDASAELEQIEEKIRKLSKN